MAEKKKTTIRKKTAVASTKSKIKKTPEPRVIAPEKQEEKTSSTKIKNPKIYIPLIVIVVIAVLAYMFKGWFIVAIVNGQPISRTAYVHQLEVQDGQQVLSSLIVETLIQQEADKRHISVSQKEMDDYVKTINNQLSKQGQTIDSALAARGMSKQDFLNQVRTQKLVEKILGPQIAVSDKEVEDYIAQNKDAFAPGTSDADMKSQAKQQLQQQKLNDKASGWIQQLQQKAKITKFVNY